MAIKNQKGGAAIEFAIVLPLLVLMFVGISEFGLLWYNKQVITNASREGARAGIARAADSTDTTNGIESIVNAYCDSRLITFGAAGDPSTSYPQGDNMGKAFGDEFSVEVAYEYNFLAPGFFNLGLKKTFVGRTMMKMEHFIAP